MTALKMPNWPPHPRRPTAPEKGRKRSDSLQFVAPLETHLSPRTQKIRAFIIAPNQSKNRAPDKNSVNPCEGRVLLDSKISGSPRQSYQFADFWAVRISTLR